MAVAVANPVTSNYDPHWRFWPKFFSFQYSTTRGLAGVLKSSKNARYIWILISTRFRKSCKKYKNLKRPVSNDFPSCFLNPIPTRLCHAIYCHGDKSYPCLVGIGLNRAPIIHTYSDFSYISASFEIFATPGWIVEPLVKTLGTWKELSSKVPLCDWGVHSDQYRKEIASCRKMKITAIKVYQVVNCKCSSGYELFNYDAGRVSNEDPVFFLLIFPPHCLEKEI